MRWLTVIVGLIWLAGSVSLISAADPLVKVRFRDQDRSTGTLRIVERTVQGRSLVQALDGGLLIEDQSGCLWPITASQTPAVEKLDSEFQLLNADALAEQLRQEFGTEFEIVRTPHYLICTSAGQGYGEWCGDLFERLHGGFHRFWKDRIPGLAEQERPLVAIAFGTAAEYQKFQAIDAQGQVASAQGYFNARTNRMVLYDQSGPDAGNRKRSEADVHKQALRQPAVITTVIHEAVHQLSFNCGLQVRYADNPSWFSEGLAMYFEAPDLNARAGWKSIGQIHPGRLERYRSLTRDQPPAIRSLIAADDRFRDPESAIDAYAEAWALHFFLIRVRKDQYKTYVQRLGAKSPLQFDTPDQRVQEFEDCFGPTATVEKDLAKFMTRLRGGR